MPNGEKATLSRCHSFWRFRLKWCCTIFLGAVSLAAPNTSFSEEGVVAEVFGGSAGLNVWAIGDSIAIRTENLDGWLITKIEAGYFNDDPYVTKYWRDYGQLVMTDGFDWDELADQPADPTTQKKYKSALTALEKKVPADEWRSTIVEAGGALNGFIRRKAADLRLVIDDVQLENLKPDVVENIPSDDESGTTVFRSAYRLIRNSQNDAKWQSLLRDWRFTRPIRMTLGLKFSNGTWIFMPTKIVPPADPHVPSPLYLQLVSRWRFFAALGLIAAALIIFASLATTDLVRDTDALPRPGAKGSTVYPISLARSQMAFWFFLVVSAYLFIWLNTDRLDGLNEQVLALIGISAGTALGAAFVTAGKPPPRTVEQEKKRADDATLSDADKELAKRRADRLEKQAKRLQRSGGFVRLLDDWLAEDGVVSFHRFQMLAWTLVLGLIFIVHVCANYSMPEFSATMLALLGISSGTYLGFKIPDTR